MRLILLRSTCEVGRTCPNVNVTDRGTYVVQGYPVPDHAALAPGESVVEVPSSLLPELAGHEATHDAVRRTDRGTVLIRGRTIVDGEVLGVEHPDGRGRRRDPDECLPELEIAHAG